jgi:hypothetical protein
MLANAAIPCIHADPYYGPVPAGQSAEARGVLVFSDEPLEQAVQKLVREGAGLPERQARRQVENRLACPRAATVSGRAACGR